MDNQTKLKGLQDEDYLSRHHLIKSDVAMLMHKYGEYAYDMVVASGEQAVTDDAQVLELALGRTSRLIEGSYRNLKVTTPEDLVVAEAFLKENRE